MKIETYNLFGDKTSVANMPARYLDAVTYSVAGYNWTVFYDGVVHIASTPPKGRLEISAE